MVSLATAGDIDAIAALNVEAYREFADRMTPGNWQKMEARIRSIEARIRSTRFLVMRDQGAIVGSVGYCPTGKGNPKIFPQDWATSAGTGAGKIQMLGTIVRNRRDHLMPCVTASLYQPLNEYPSVLTMLPDIVFCPPQRELLPMRIRSSQNSHNFYP